MDDLNRLLLESARLDIAIRQHYAKIKGDPDARFFVYVLLLQDGHVYVGNTDNIVRRLLDHTLMSGSSSIWVRLHGPVKRVIEIAKNCSRDDEMYKTLQYMDMFGYARVRGSSYCKSDLKYPPAALSTFERTRDGEFSYLTRSEIDELESDVALLARMTIIAPGT